MTFEDRHRAADAAVRSVQDVIDQASRDVGADELVGTFLIGCHLTLTGRDVILQRRLTACEGAGDTTEEIKGAFIEETLTEEGKAHVRKIALTQARAWLRTRAVQDAGKRRDPLWSFDGHVILNEIIRQSGLDPDIFAIQDVANWDAHRSVVPGNVIRMPWGALYGNEHQVTAGFVAPILTMGDDNRGVTISLDRENPCILLAGAYPQTLAQSAVGRTVMEVIPHPLFENLPTLRVTEMTSTFGMTLVNFEATNAPLAPVPAGMDAGWMELPAYRP